MKTFATFLSTFLVVGPWMASAAPASRARLLVPGARSTYYGVLGTFDVTPLQVYSPFTQTVVPQSFGYTGVLSNPSYHHFQLPQTSFTNVYTPSYQISGVPFLDAQFTQVQPLLPSVPGVEAPGSVRPVAGQGQTEAPNYQASETETPEAAPQPQNDDDDSVTIEAA